MSNTTNIHYRNTLYQLVNKLITAQSAQEALIAEDELSSAIYELTEIKFRELDTLKPAESEI